MVGRNGPCSCGSGLKYKKCCLARNEEEKRAYLRIHNARGRFHDRLMKFIVTFIPDTKEHAERFEERIGESINDQNLHAFVSLLAGSPSGDGRTLLECFQDEDSLDSLELEVARGYARANGGFYRVISTRPGVDVEATDIVFGKTYRFTDAQLSQQASVGEVLSLVAYPVENLWVVDSNAINFQGNGARVLDALARAAEERDSTLEEFAGEVGRDTVEFYIFVKSVVEEMMVPPRLANMDGEPILVAKARYRVNDFAALERFLKENEEFSLDDFVSEAELSATWLENSDRRLVLSNLRVKGGKLVAEANSKDRLERLRSVLESALGDAIAFKGETVQDIERVIEEGAGRPRFRQRDVPDVDPEIMHQIAEDYLRDFYMKWLDESIPALGGLTPREAVKTPDGRRQVEVLLDDIAANSIQWIAGPAKPDVDRIRRELGLPVREAANQER